MNFLVGSLFFWTSAQLVVSRPMESTPSRVSKSVMVDLSYTFDSKTIYWPTAKRFQHEIVFRNYTEAGFYYEVNDFAAAEHGGTHLDAPSHFCDPAGEVKCWRSDEIPLERLRGEGVLVDVSSLVSWPDGRDVLITAADLRTRLAAWEETRGRDVPEGAFLLIYTGWGKFYGDEAKYLGNADRDTSDLHFPSLHPDAASWLVAHPSRISMVGIDTASIDYGLSTDFSVHQILLGANIPALENLANLDKLAGEVKEDDGSRMKKIEITALPMKIKDGSGGPARVLAVVTNGATGRGSPIYSRQMFIFEIVAFTFVSSYFV